MRQLTPKTWSLGPQSSVQRVETFANLVNWRTWHPTRRVVAALVVAPFLVVVSSCGQQPRAIVEGLPRLYESWPVGASYAPCIAISNEEPAQNVPCWKPDPRRLADLFMAVNEMETSADSRIRLLARLHASTGIEGLDKAVSMLEKELRRSHRSDSILLNNLAAAHLDRAAERGSPFDLHRAYEAADRAHELSPSRPEPAFNRALALQSLFLWDGARQAWETALSLIDDPGFREEADQRRQRCIRELKWIRQPDRLSVNSTEQLQQLRTDLFDWAGAMVENSLDQAEGFLEAARRTAEMIAELFGDRSFLAAVHLLGGINSADDPLVQAHLALGPTSKALETTCDRILFETEKRLSVAGSPFALFVALELAECLYYRTDYTNAGQSLQAIAVATEGKHPLLWARASWLRGTNAHHEGFPEESLRGYQDARAFYSKVGDRGRAAFLDLLTGLSLSAMSLEEEAWRKRFLALEQRDAIRRRDRQFTLMQDAASSLEAQGLLRTSLAFRDAQVQVSQTDDDRDVDLSPLSLIERARTLFRLGRLALGDRDMTRATTLIEGLPETHVNKSRVEAKLDALRAELWARHRSDESLAAAHRALSYFEGSTVRGADRLNVLRLNMLIGEVHRHHEQSELSRKHLDRSLTLAEEFRTSIRDPRLRVRFLEQFAELADQLVMAELDLDRPLEALVALDRTVNRLVVDSSLEAHSTPIRSDDIENNRLDSSTSVLVLHSLPEKLLRWTISRSGWTYSWAPISREALLVQLQSEPAPDHLYELLIPEEIRSSTSLAILPVGPLADFPFATLRPSASANPLVETHRLSRLVNLRPLVTDSRAPASDSGTALVLLGGVGRMSPTLPYVESEIDELRQIYRNLAIARVSEISPALHTLQPMILHFSGHAFVDPTDPFRAQLGDDDESVDFLDILRAPAIPGSTVMLAACNTATRGLLDSGEDASLATAFLSAGARSVVASLAPVTDRETAELSLEFHREFSRGESAVDALQRARLNNLAKGGRAWRDFVLVTASLE